MNQPKALPKAPVTDAPKPRAATIKKLLTKPIKGGMIRPYGA